MKNKFGYIISALLVIVVVTGCTKYASAPPATETPQALQMPAAPTIAIPTPTLAALEVEVATRTPIPLILKTATPTTSISDILTATLPESATTGVTGNAINPSLKLTSQTGDFMKTLVAAGTPVEAITVTADINGVMGTPTSNGLPTRAPVVVISGKPTISIDHVQYAQSISVTITNLDPGTMLKIRMGSPRSYATDGPVVDTVTADQNGSVSGTYQIPQAFIGYGQIEFRIEYPDGTPYYFPFYNNNY